MAPEDTALLATRALLTEINRGGCVDRQHQSLVLLMMVLGSEDVGRCRMGEPTPRTSVAFYFNGIQPSNVFFFFRCTEFNFSEMCRVSSERHSKLYLRTLRTPLLSFYILVMAQAISMPIELSLDGMLARYTGTSMSGAVCFLINC